MGNELKKAVKAFLDYIKERDVCDEICYDGDGHVDAWHSDELDTLLEDMRKALNPRNYELQRKMREPGKVLSIGGNHERTYICAVREWPPTNTPSGWRLKIWATFHVLESLQQNRLCEHKVGEVTFNGLEAVSYDASLAVDPDIGKYDSIQAELYFQECYASPDLGSRCDEEYGYAKDS